MSSENRHFWRPINAGGRILRCHARIPRIKQDQYRVIQYRTISRELMHGTTHLSLFEANTTQFCRETMQGTTHLFSKQKQGNPAENECTEPHISVRRKNDQNRKKSWTNNMKLKARLLKEVPKGRGREGGRHRWGEGVGGGNGGRDGGGSGDTP